MEWLTWLYCRNENQNVTRNIVNINSEGKVLYESSQSTDFNAVWCGAELPHGKIQPHADPTAHPERSVQPWWERPLESMERNQLIIHTIESQSPCGPVQKHPDSRAVAHRDLHLLIGVHGCAAHVWQLQAPRLAVIPKPRPWICPFAGHGTTDHTQRGATPPPLHLPVAALWGEGLETEHLRPAVEALREVGVRLRRLLKGGHGVCIRQDQTPMGRVWIQGQITSI